MHIKDMNNKKQHEAIDLYDVKLTDQDVKAHIKFVLYKDIEIHLKLAYELSFKLLEDADVDVDNLEELEFQFTQTKESLISFNKYQMKHSSKNDPEIENTSKLYPSLN